MRSARLDCRGSSVNEQCLSWIDWKLEQKPEGGIGARYAISGLSFENLLCKSEDCSGLLLPRLHASAFLSSAPLRYRTCARQVSMMATVSHAAHVWRLSGAYSTFNLK